MRSKAFNIRTFSFQSKNLTLGGSPGSYLARSYLIATVIKPQMTKTSQDNNWIIISIIAVFSSIFMNILLKN